MNLDETTCFNAARAGDQEAFAQLMDPYRREILVHCYRILGSFEDAEDMLQETLVRAWKHLGSFEGRSSLRAWLYKVATQPGYAAPAQKVSGVEPISDEWIDGYPFKSMDPFKVRLEAVRANGSVGNLSRCRDPHTDC